ncbi:uncharacterized protein DNG_05969 [Cephalotrichum gorgonifer]|uniref:Uncharacterized protein n=1 Tax=Cephalotrichum gorgonifer TaxID=2041049 RepID=A0AAE8SWS0_9PEZI|nr:uncharacterized protein DNG_05969 [Cephalotrichum gorgonifer]
MDEARDHSADHEYGAAPLTMRKRPKHSPLPETSPPGPAAESTTTPLPAHAQEMAPIPGGDASQQIPPDTISPSRKRAKSPSSARGKRASKKARRRAKAAEAKEEEEERHIVDPVRAALTWQEDEITVYDPDDADDDGTGMDGVGFLAPPAAARATAQKKIRQLAEYRRMVQREARAGRNQRRRGAAAANADGGNGRVTRVRFLEPEPTITFG